MNNVDKVKLLIAAVDVNFPIFTNEQYEAFLEMHNDDIHRAAASALRAVAIDEALLRDIKTDDLQVTSSTIARTLLDAAKALDARADAQDALESSELFEIVNGPQYCVPELHPRWY